MSTRPPRATQGTETTRLRQLIWETSQPHSFARLLLLEQLGITDCKRATLNCETLLAYGYSMSQYVPKPPPTTCARGHDLTVPGRRREYRYSYGIRYACLACIGDRNREAQRKRALRLVDKVCKVCGKAFRTAHNAVVCGGGCQNSYVAKQTAKGMHWQRNEQVMQMHAAAILRLHEERDRCATHWERAEVDARIAELRARNAL